MAAAATAAVKGCTYIIRMYLLFFQRFPSKFTDVSPRVVAVVVVAVFVVVVFNVPAYLYISSLFFTTSTPANRAVISGKKNPVVYF